MGERIAIKFFMPVGRAPGHQTYPKIVAKSLLPRHSVYWGPYYDNGRNLCVKVKYDHLPMTRSSAVAEKPPTQTLHTIHSENGHFLYMFSYARCMPLSSTVSEIFDLNCRLCVFCGRGRRRRTRTRTLCIRRTLCRHVTIWYTNGHFCCFDCLLTVFDDWYTVPIVKNSQNHWCIDRHRSTKTVPTVYQQCTNRQKQSKTVKRQLKQQKWPLVYQSSHVNT